MSSLAIPLSILDLAPIREGGTVADALHESLALARAAERLGYRRHWVAEHHGMPGIASAATAVVMAHLAAGTSTIRIGAGGIMLPNHAPLVIAEQFGTLAALHPGRIDLGLGRAPGSDGRTARALRRDPARADAFADDVRELQQLLARPSPTQAIVATPGAGSDVPLWILGSSLFGAQLAAAYGLPFAFASHFAPDALMDALAIYRRRFVPSAQLEQPYAMLGLNVLAAETDAAARRSFTTVQQAFANLVRGQPGKFRPPVADIEGHWSAAEKQHAEHMLRHAVVGSPSTVRDGLARFVEQTRANELIITTTTWDPAQRLASYAIVAELAGLEGAAALPPAS
ncbi:MAG: LLM class flavin-dependent oxidoreductase [Deltaproteobacteria bacterium]|nr:LLM class flavin-dependent oxidoreductase [Deltaproteobacteria bacterium]MBK8716385.1 LLM class flavin-dependent oxidoreductase [Deltaproteobacteria bacterium]MBP7287894.1 LLM class flavin-dependent oxidoreductase [Nannocystaceae bacterium]